MNILDYLDWRGDLSFETVPANEIDALIFAWLSYYHFEDIEGDGIDGLTLSELAALHERCVGPFTKVNTNITIEPQITAAWLLHCCAETARFGPIRVKDFSEELDAEEAVQFAAISFLIGDDWRIIAFRGTDNNLAGWKEDCYLAFSEAVPAQKLAAEYLEKTRDGRKVLVCGHSKGGNLAMFAVLCASDERLKDVQMLYNFDGPGFSFELEKHPNYPIVKERAHTIVPASSVVGMLLNHEDDYRVVESQAVSIWQHDAMFWKVLGGSFVYTEERNASSVFIDNTLREWIDSMSFDERKEFVDGVFSVLESTGATQLNELPEKIAQNGIRAITQFPLNAEQRSMIFHLLMNLLKTGGANLYETVMGNDDAKQLEEESNAVLQKGHHKERMTPEDVARKGSAAISAAMDRARDAISSRFAGKIDPREAEQDEQSDGTDGSDEQ